MPPVRRLTAILAADVAGYSRLMGADEEGTHERLRGHLLDLIEPKIVEYRGPDQRRPPSRRRRAGDTAPVVIGIIGP
jgi:class 3 adenylate cyclase